jgi:hypothetical protein
MRKKLDKFLKTSETIFTHMLRVFVKKITTLFLVGAIFFSGFYPNAFISLIQEAVKYARGEVIVDKIYLARQNKNVVDNFLSGVHKAEAALAPGEREYMLNVGPVTGSTAANYVYASFFNPSGSGRAVVIKRIAIRSNTGNTTAANYVNLSLRRTTTGSAGTQITAANIPKKNASSSDAVLEVRHTGVTVAFAGATESRILGLPQSGAVGAYYGYRDITFGDNDEKIILQPGEGMAVYQEAAGDVDSRVRVYIEWEEPGNIPTAQNEFLFAFPRVENAAAANYTYNSFFNPLTSGKAAIVKRIWYGAETCDGAAVYTNNIVLRRISNATGGTAVASSSIPKKNTSGATTSMEFRHTNVTETLVGGTDARLGHVTPCGAAGQATGWQEIDFHTSDEKLILQQGEGIALISDATGNANQIVRMIIEWQEVAIAQVPSSQGEYIWASDKVAAATAANTTLYSFFNPTGSGKVAVIKRLAIRANATTTAAYTSFQFRRLTVATGGTLVASTSMPKKHTGTATSSMEVRWCLQACTSAITATYASTADARIISVTGAGVVGQTIGQYDIVFGDNEKIVLREGEGVGLYNDVLTSSAAESVKILIEWDEETSAPTAEEEYVMSVGPINGVITNPYNYVSFFNPSGSGKTAIIKRVGVRVNAVNAALYIPMQLRRTTAASAGTLVASSSYPKKNTSSATSSMEIRHTNVTVTYAGTNDSKLLAVQTPGAVAGAASGNTGHREYVFENEEYIIVQPGEGVGFYQDAAGDVDLRVRVLFEWQEVDSASTPASQGDYLITTGPINQSLVNNYVYTSFFNPATSSKKYVVKRIGMQVNRSGAATAPIYIPISVRKISSANVGTAIATTSVPKKHTGTATTSAHILTTGVTVSFTGVTDSRLINAMDPGAVNQPFGQFDSKIVYGDELILLPGEGFALYQEGTTGDTNVRYRFSVGWNEVEISQPPQTLSFSISTSTAYFGTLSTTQARYASSTDQGASSEVEAFTLQVNTNAVSGYVVTVQGATLTSGSDTITAIGSTNTTSSTGTEQFGMRFSATGGSGFVVSPYSASGFAYDATATTSSAIGASTVGDNATTTFSARLITNIGGTTEVGNYTTQLVYVATANF